MRIVLRSKYTKDRVPLFIKDILDMDSFPDDSSYSL